MASRERPVDRGTIRGRWSIVDVADEIRSARLDRALSLRAVGRATGQSHSTVSRIERGLAPHVTLLLLSRLSAVVGLELSVRCFPGGQPIRDVAQVALPARFRQRLHSSIKWAVEVPPPQPGDQRAWDALVTGTGWRFGVEAETAPHDGQALARRLELKRRDGEVGGVILVLPNARRTRMFLREFVTTVADNFPVCTGCTHPNLSAAGPRVVCTGCTDDPSSCIRCKQGGLDGPDSDGSRRATRAADPAAERRRPYSR